MTDEEESKIIQMRTEQDEDKVYTASVKEEYVQAFLQVVSEREAARADVDFYLARLTRLTELCVDVIYGPSSADSARATGELEDLLKEWNYVRR